MMSDSKTNRPINEREKEDLLKDLIRERYGEWAINKQISVEQPKESQ